MTGNSAAPDRVMAIGISGAFLIGLDAMVVAPLIPAIADDAQVSARLGGLLVGVYALMFALSAPLFGALSDRLGRRRILTAGLGVFVIGNALTGLGMNFPFLLACRALSGLGAAMIMPSVYAMISDTHPFEQRGKAIGKVVAGLLSSSVIGVPIGSYLAFLTSWRSAFVVIAIAAALVYALALVLLPQMAGGPRKAPVGKAVLGMVRSAVSTPAVLFVLLCTLLWAAALYGMFSNIGTFYAERFRLNEAQAGLTIMGSGAGSMAGALLGGRIADRFGKRKVMVVAALVAAAGVIATPSIGNDLVLVLIAFIAWGTAAGIGQPCLTSLVSELRPEIRGTALALNGSAQYLGMTLATSLAALLLERGASFVVIGLICGACALLVLPLLAGIKGVPGTVRRKPAEKTADSAR